MARRVHIPRKELGDYESRAPVVIAAYEEKGWVKVCIGPYQTSPRWHEISRFLDDPNRPGEYITLSMSINPGVSYTEQIFRQHYWFSDPNTAFEFKMNFG